MSASVTCVKGKKNIECLQVSHGEHLKHSLQSILRYTLTVNVGGHSEVSWQMTIVQCGTIERNCSKVIMRQLLEA